LSVIFSGHLKPRNDIFVTSTFRRWNCHHQWDSFHQACLLHLNDLLCSHPTFFISLPPYSMLCWRFWCIWTSLHMNGLIIFPEFHWNWMVHLWGSY
jgi:hypothetical protein